MKHVIVGFIAIGLAIWGLIVWWATFGIVMRGVIPFCLLVFGLVSIASGLRKVQTQKHSPKGASGQGK